MQWKEITNKEILEKKSNSKALFVDQSAKLN